MRLRLFGGICAEGMEVDGVVDGRLRRTARPMPPIHATFYLSQLIALVLS